MSESFFAKERNIVQAEARGLARQHCTYAKHGPVAASDDALS